ncbi:MAG: hypothetical protein H6602_03500 [Flavobacteriales bacterium]|nr:hypothetical protein [Flavobacteriales bacterium]MCB9190710.1 hypothetical protein [Flavobacteriales bacterium]
MKHLFTLILLAATFSAFAQAPQSINYQGVARDNGGNVLANQNVGLKFSILDNDGITVLYAEDWLATTNDFGLFNIQVGDGTVLSGSFSGISWANGPYFLKVEMDPSGGTSYMNLGTSQLLSVPYALYAENSGNGLPSGPSGSTIRHNGSGWMANTNLFNNGTNVGIGTTSPSEKLDVDGNSEVTGDYTYATAKTHYQSFSWNSFISVFPQSYQFGQSSTSIVRYGEFVTGSAGLGYAVAPLNLPDEAIVTEIRAWIWDNDSSSPVRVRFYSQPLGSETASLISTIESATATAISSVQELSSSSTATIDNESNSYFLRFTGAQGSNDTRLYAVRVTYTVNQAD